MRKAVVVGCKGQDGQLLYELLLKKNYKLLGIARTFIRTTESDWTEPIDIRDTATVFELIRAFQPDEIYYLAAFQHSSEEALPDNIELFQQSYSVNVSSLVNFLEGIRRFSVNTKLFYAASCRVFGLASGGLQDEDTPLNPNCIYGISKTAGLLTCRFYRRNYSVFASAGILYNHESSLRHSKFISKKIIRCAVNIKNKMQDRLIVGDLNAEVDWGYAPDYVEAMHRILTLRSADDFVIATGEKHTVLDFINAAFGYAGLDWQPYVKENPNIVAKQKSALVGNPKKLMTLTGWRPTVNFDQMVGVLLAEEEAAHGER